MFNIFLVIIGFIKQFFLPTDQIFHEQFEVAVFNTCHSVSFYSEIVLVEAEANPPVTIAVSGNLNTVSHFHYTIDNFSNN